ncbi:MAG: hypothetical protein EOO77_19495 [Oxalobacteraceae bacterium]|jgi:hypothetical protein|nr:MAG: hypothetical protein EOO77_19495 [Oxalobacteraceae bacterium]
MIEEQFYRHDYAPWGSTYSVITNQASNGSALYSELQIRTGDSIATLHLGFNSATMLALAAALTRAAEKIEDRGLESIQWRVIGGEKQPDRDIADSEEISND